MIKFIPRSYQYPIVKAFEKDAYKKLLIVSPRRSGKDLVAWNLMIRQAIRQTGVYFYCLPTFKQARLVLWDSITNDGNRFLDYIPEQLILKKNSQEMKIYLKNGSIIQLIGSDTYDTSLVGTNARMIVFSEYALANPQAYQFVRPLLNANNGSVIIISTPRAKNHFYDLYRIAESTEDWFCLRLTLDDTKHIDPELITKEIESGEMSEELAQQEYYCSFDRGQEGAVYGKYLDTLRLRNGITLVPYDSQYPVHTAWDIGVRDATSIIFFQCQGTAITIIDCYEQSNVGLEHYVKYLKSLPYNYGTHLAPHDIAVRDFSTGVSRIQKAQELGISFTIVSKLSIEDGIEAVRSLLSRILIDEKKGKHLIKALESYHYEFDHKRNVYSACPVHDQFSHICDALRTLAVGLAHITTQSTPEELEMRYRKTKYGMQNELPYPFNTRNNWW